MRSPPGRGSSRQGLRLLLAPGRSRRSVRNGNPSLCQSVADHVRQFPLLGRPQLVTDTDEQIDEGRGVPRGLLFVGLEHETEDAGEFDELLARVFDLSAVAAFGAR